MNENIQIKPFLHGGGQERNMRAGTEKYIYIVGFAKALELATENMEADTAYILSQKYMHQQLNEK